MSPDGASIVKFYIQNIFSIVTEKLLTDKFYFCLNGSVNKQSFWFYVTENPQSAHEETCYNRKFIVLAGICSKMIIRS